MVNRVSSLVLMDEADYGLSDFSGIKKFFRGLSFLSRNRKVCATDNVTNYCVQVQDLELVYP